MSNKWMKVTGRLDAAIFGPVDSRRYGRSLGINPLPADRKICQFNCPYCECGWTEASASRNPAPEEFPPTAEIARALEHRLSHSDPIDAITFAGNGEPTLHPEFPRLMADTRALRDRWAPAAKVNVLTNGLTMDAPAISEALARADCAAFKLDAGSPELFRQIARPVNPLDFQALVSRLIEWPRPVIQTMFIEGGVDNAGPGPVADWLNILRTIAPSRVQIYTIERPPPDSALRAVSRERMQAIANRVRHSGIAVDLF